MRFVLALIFTFFTTTMLSEAFADEPSRNDAGRIVEEYIAKLCSSVDANVFSKGKKVKCSVPKIGLKGKRDPRDYNDFRYGFFAEIEFEKPILLNIHGQFNTACHGDCKKVGVSEKIRYFGEIIFLKRDSHWNHYNTYFKNAQVLPR